MFPRLAKVNGINLAYRVQGEGPPLVLVMGYRLNSTAWPATFIERLAERFTVVTPDNRGTGLSDKPVEGYALANMARDIAGLLDGLKIDRVHLLGYSMGGAIAQEFVRQFPDRVDRLLLCATMAGGPSANYADASVSSVMRDLDGLSPEQAARRIWKVTYAPGYLEQHRALAEDQMRREIALPTPLHAADLQFQAFAEFDGSQALTAIRCPTLVLTGDLDELIPPKNSLMIAKLIPGAKLVVIHGGGHRVLWEAQQKCFELITEFLGSASSEIALPLPEVGFRRQRTASNSSSSTIELFANWPSLLARAGFEALTIARQSIMAGSASQYGDGKPVILVPLLLGSDLTLVPISLWLKALGYRPVLAGLLLNLGGSHGDRALSRAIRDTTGRIGRKAVLLAHYSGVTQALRMAALHPEWISDVVILAAARRHSDESVRTHYISSGWSLTKGIVELPRILRNIGIELIEESTSSDNRTRHLGTRTTARKRQT
ncbi:MAG TPA: alpha/beta hydrolase [Bradyrhizobium sp.]|nr:alpha/beta hydrolase [Bradyrhizobium sp.]